MARAGTIDVAGTPVELLTGEKPVEEIHIQVDSDSDDALVVKVQNAKGPHIHNDSDEGYTMLPGESMTFAASLDNRINSVSLLNSGGGAGEHATGRWTVTKA